MLVGESPCLKLFGVHLPQSTDIMEQQLVENLFTLLRQGVFLKSVYHQNIVHQPRFQGLAIIALLSHIAPHGERCLESIHRITT